MKKRIFIVVATFFSIAVLAGPKVTVQGYPQNPKYDKKKEVTVKGNVLQYFPGEGKEPGISVLLKNIRWYVKHSFGAPPS